MTARATYADRCGFTLLEVLIALMILGIGVMAVMQMFPPTMTLMRVATERTDIAAQAQKEFGVLRARGITGERHTLNWPMHHQSASHPEGDAYVHHTVQPVAVPDVDLDAENAGQVQTRYIYRVTLQIPRVGGRHETFTTYVSKY